jgi:tetratricopeptide (TPR) repeat protein
MTSRCRAATAAVIVCSCLVAASGCGTSAEEHLARGDSFARQGKHTEAIAEFRRAIQENDRYGRAYYRLAQASEQVHDYTNAAKNYILAGQMLPDDAAAQIQSATMLLLGKRFDEALACTQQALHLDPRNVRARILHAHALSGLKRTGEALSSIQKAVALDPTRGDTYADFGVFQFVTGSFEQGEENLKKAAEAQPPSLPAQMTLASLYWAQGRLEDAERYLRRAAEVDGDGVVASRALATFYLGNSRTTDAEQYLRAIADRSRTVASRLALADYYIVLDRQPDAVRILENVAAAKDGYAEARSRLAAVSYANGDTSGAHRLIDETINASPHSSRALMTKGNFLIAEHKLDEARKRLEAAVEADRQSVPARYALASLYAATQNVPSAMEQFDRILQLDPASVPTRVELARLNLAGGRGATAAQFAQQVADSRPSVDASLLYARTLVASGEISRAETILRPHLESTTRSDVLSLAGEVYVGIGESERGRALLEKAARLNVDDVEPIESLVSMDLALGNIARARVLAEQRLARQPRDARLLILAARTYGAGGDTERMVATLRLAIEADSANTSAYALLGQVFAAQGRLKEALIEYEHVVSRDPASVPAHTMAAFLLERLGRSMEAEKRYQRVLQLDPRSPVAANNLAWLMAERGGDLDTALRLAQVAKEVLPEAPDVNDTLAWIYYRKDLPDMALPAVRLAVEGGPNNAVYHYHAGLVYLKTGDIESARRSFERALRLDPNFSGAAQARQQLTRLQ